MRGRQVRSTELEPVGAPRPRVTSNECLIGHAGFTLLAREDVTDAAAVIAQRWRIAREQHREGLVAREGAAHFDGLQRFLACEAEASWE